MRLQNWIWLYLAAGESFTRWAALLFSGAVGAVVVVAAGLISILALAMLWFG